MAVGTVNLMRSARRNAPEIGGGVVGVGAPVALRELADVRDGREVSIIGEPGSLMARLTRPSVAWGLGAGSITGALWMLGAGPRWLQDFYLTHTLTGIPSGAVSALVPRESPTGGGAGAESRLMGDQRPGSRGSRGGGSDFDPAGGQSVETEPAQ